MLEAAVGSSSPTKVSWPGTKFLIASISVSLSPLLNYFYDLTVQLDVAWLTPLFIRAGFPVFGLDGCFVKPQPAKPQLCKHITTVLVSSSVLSRPCWVPSSAPGLTWPVLRNLREVAPRLPDLGLALCCPLLAARRTSHGKTAWSKAPYSSSNRL